MILVRTCSDRIWELRTGLHLSCQLECVFFCPSLLDFRALSAVLLIFTTGSLAQCRRIEIMDDGGVEDNESFTVVLMTDSSIARINPGASSTAVTILDDDSTFLVHSSGVYAAFSFAYCNKQNYTALLPYRHLFSEQLLSIQYTNIYKY